MFAIQHMTNRNENDIFRFGNIINWRQKVTTIMATLTVEEIRILALAQEIAKNLKANTE
uniref:Uncharacterized protein n=1 Tax=Candidatus Kentrum sp. LPFa TaxID=2126335 RepID=A0A450WGI9_9GAMM|nr:MAG: hypothetical protein BECKLPF1236B_GA0070989_10899 [Candidatus Kentron sp. LPFa]